MIDTLELTNVAISVLSFAGTLLAGFVAWFLKEKVDHTKIAKVNETVSKVYNEFVLKQGWVMDAVRYAEQTFIGDKGTKKYDAAVDYVVKKAKEYGITITSDELKVMIEAQVQKLKESASGSWDNAVELGGQANTNSTVNTDTAATSFQAEANNTKKEWKKNF